MEITFVDPPARGLFCRRERIEATFGPELARLICCRLSILRSAKTLALLPRDPPISLVPVGGSRTRFAVSLGKTHRLEFEVPGAASSDTDELMAASVRIIGVKPTPIHKERTP